MCSSLRAIIRRAVYGKLRITVRNDRDYQARAAIMSSMSNVLLLVITIMTLLSINSATLSFESCATNSECQPSSCCLLGALNVSGVLLGPSRYAIPTCMPFQEKGKYCRVNADTVTTNLSYPDKSQIEVKGIHFILCPCADGLSCNPKLGICN